VSLVGLFQTFVIASFFGASRTVEIFFAALAFQMSLQQITNSGQVSELFTPIFHDIQKAHGEQKSHAAVSAMLNIMCLVSTFLAIVAMLFTDQIANLIVPGYSLAETQLCSRVFFIVSPLIIVKVAIGFLGNVIRAQHHYEVRAWVGLAARIVYLAILLLLGRKLGLWALVIGLWSSSLVSVTGLIAYMFYKGYRHRFLLRSEEFSPLAVITRIPFSFLHIIANQFASIAITASFSHLEAGPYATYGYAMRIHSKIQGTILQPIGVIFFNHLSDARAAANRQIRKYADEALSIAIALSAFFSVAVISSSDLLLTGLLGGKSFSVEQINQCHLVMSVLAILLIFNAQYLVSRRTNLAFKVVFPQYTATAAVIFLAGLSSYWVIPKFGISGALVIHVFSVASCAIVSYAVTCFFNPNVAALLPLSKTVRWIVAIAATSALIICARKILGISPTGDRWLLFLQSGITSLFAVGVCAIVSIFLGLEEARSLIYRAKAKLSKSG